MRVVLGMLVLLAGCVAAPPESNRWKKCALREPSRSVVSSPEEIRSEVAFSFEGVSIREVAAEIARQSGKNIVVARGVEVPVTLSVHDLSWRQALELVCERSRCEVEQVGSVFYVVEPPRVTITGCF